MKESVHSQHTGKMDVQVQIMDVGRTPTENDKIDIKQPQVVNKSTATKDKDVEITKLPRNEYIQHIITGAITIVKEKYQAGEVDGIIGLGGTSGTALASAVMRIALPVGFPKLMVSTMGSANVKPYVEETDITMMYSVVDIAGMNSILEMVLGNAAGAISGMALAYNRRQELHKQQGQLQSKHNKRIGMTMFGLTTPCVERIRQYLTTYHGYEIYIFHATGSGGKAMERLVAEHQLDAIMDMTTTEIADFTVGGILTCGPERLDSAVEAGIPQILSVGACDMVNFGAPDTIPDIFTRRDTRTFHKHNPSITLMRTTPDECRQIGRFIVSKLLRAVRPDRVIVVLPLGGISGIDAPGLDFYHPHADSVLFDTLEDGLRGSGVRVLRDHRHINDPDFAVSLAKLFVELLGSSG